jgi:endonuclease/exonuclease/phosphatase (EEP) superfamily protein YafD
LGTMHFDVLSLPPGRARQARAMTAAATGESCVIGGDLNVLPWFERAMTICRDAFPETQQGDTLSSHPARFRNKIDYQFYRLPVRYRTEPYFRVASRYHSDHNPQLGFVTFHPRNS